MIEATRRQRRGRPALRAVGWTVCGALLVALVLVSFADARALAYRGEALPWVRVAGVDVGGASRKQIEERLRSALGRRLATPVTLVAAGHRIQVSPGAVLRLDAPATADRALAVRRGSLLGRSVTLVSPVPMRANVMPVLHGRGAGIRRLLAQLQGFARTPSPARVVLHGTTVSVVPAATGTRVDGPTLLRALGRVVVQGRTAPIAVAYALRRPSVEDAAARVVAAQLRVDLSAPVELDYGGAPVTLLSPDRLARLVLLHEVRGSYAISLDEARLAKILAPLLAPWRRRAANARFVVHGARVSIVPSRDGIDVDAHSAAQLILSAAASPADADRRAALALQARAPDLTTAKAEKLGIRQRLVTFTTEMGASSSNRIHNVHLMADFIDGTIIRPGQVFSFNDVVGPRTAERGFLEGQEIIGSVVIPSIGGGVCQTATTLFNDAFETGLPILARTNHNLYLSHYPLGRDATVAWGGPDFRFRNDLKHAILIKSSYTDATLTFTFFGTPEGRRIVSTTGPKVNWREPTMSYAIDPSAPRGSVRIVSGSSESGFDITVFRSVFKGQKLLRKDSFASHYVPGGPTAIYGPGRTPPGPYVVLPPNSGV